MGTPADHLDRLEAMAATDEGTNWTVNSQAVVGDQVLFYLSAPLSALVARGTVTSPPKRRNNPRARWYGHYMADIDAITLLPRRIPVRELKAEFPQWRWLLSPIKSSRIPEDIVAPLEALIANVASAANETTIPDIDEDAFAAVEGGTEWSHHLRRERSAKLGRRKRNAVLRETGALACEVCGFDFVEKYGTVGEGFCELHHLLPLANTAQRRKTRLEDLAVVCSNCHRIIHRTKPMLTPQQLRKRVASGARQQFATVLTPGARRIREERDRLESARRDKAVRLVHPK